MSLKGPGMRAYAEGERVHLFGLPGTVLRCRPLDVGDPPRVFEATVRLDNGAVAIGLTSWFRREGEPPPCGDQRGFGGVESAYVTA